MNAFFLLSHIGTKTCLEAASHVVWNRNLLTPDNRNKPLSLNPDVLDKGSLGNIKSKNTRSREKMILPWRNLHNDNYRNYGICPWWKWRKLREKCLLRLKGSHRKTTQYPTTSILCFWKDLKTAVNSLTPFSMGSNQNSSLIRAMACMALPNTKQEKKTVQSF